MEDLVDVDGRGAGPVGGPAGEGGPAVRRLGPALPALLVVGIILLSVFAWEWAVPRVTPGDPACLAAWHPKPPPPGMPAASIFCGDRIDTGPTVLGWIAVAGGLALVATAVRGLYRWPDSLR